MKTAVSRQIKHHPDLPYLVSSAAGAIFIRFSIKEALCVHGVGALPVGAIVPYSPAFDTLTPGESVTLTQE